MLLQIHGLQKMIRTLNDKYIGKQKHDEMKMMTAFVCFTLIKHFRRY